MDSVYSKVVVALADALREDDLACLLPKVLEELGDLVSVHAGGRHLDRARPVEVVVAQVKSELLNDCFGKLTIVEGDIEVSGEDTALSSGLRDQVEVVLSLAVLVLHDLGVDQATRGWVHDTTAVLQEESLSDPLVDDDNSDVRLLLGQVVGLVDGLPQLGDLLLQHLSAHPIAHTVAIDNKVVWVVTTSISEAAEGSLDGVLELDTHDLLALLLDDPL